MSKVNQNCTYLSNANYWAPLADENDDNEIDGEAPVQQDTINNTSDAQAQSNLQSTIIAWLYHRMSKHKPFQRKASTMVVDSGATSSFVRPEENLPITGSSSKIFALPDGSTKQATHTAIVPFKSLSDTARRADVLPELRPNSLVSVGKLADADYTTIFHPQGEGVTVHEKNTIQVKLLSKPVLQQGWRDTNGLWRLSSDDEIPTVHTSNEVAANVSLPSMPQTICYLHAAVGFPTKDLWIKAIKNGNYATWPGITVEAVNKHFPKSVKTQKGHMKKQRQNVRSTKQKVSVDKEPDKVELTRTITKQNILVKVINASETVFTNQTGRFPVQLSRGNT